MHSRYTEANICFGKDGAGEVVWKYNRPTIMRRLASYHLIIPTLYGKEHKEVEK
jgi:hypothetical protein